MKTLNPFRNNIVTDPWDPRNIDVREINADAFELCHSALERVRVEGRSTSVLLSGEAGSGKTHLLSRLRSYLETQSQPHVFISIRLHSSPNRLWRHIRKCFVDSLLRHSDYNRSQLELLFMHHLYLHSQKKYSTIKQLRRDIEELDLDAELSWNLSKVIENLVCKRHLRDSITWLKGHSLPSKVIENIGLALGKDEIHDPEDQARKIIYEFCRMAGPTTPVVVCFDQVEALQRYPRDIESLLAFGRVIRSLHDETNNVLLVSCIQSFFLEQLKKTLTEADYKVLAMSGMTLKPLTFELSLKLVEALLENSPNLSRQRKRLYSDIEKKLKQIIWMKTGRTARKVLARCAELFDDWEKSKSLDDAHPRAKQSDKDFLMAEFVGREEKAIQDNQPVEMDEVIQSAVPVLVHLMDESWKEQDHRPLRDVDIVLQGPVSKIAISICNPQDLRALTGRFKRLRTQIPGSNFDKLVLICHPQLPIHLEVKKTREYFEKLMQQNPVFISPDIELLAALDALRKLIADAKAGDLANGGRAVDSVTVVEWVKENMSVYIKEFLDQIIGHSSANMFDDVELLQNLHALLEEEGIIKLDEAAVRLKVDFSRIQDIAMKYPKQIGYLQGPPPLIFQFIPDSIQD